ncbi:MAG: linear amide C-N hydrolase [Anaeroplasmataceae bacterium]
MSRLKKVLLVVITSLVVVLLALVITAYAIWHNELSSYMSIEKISDRDDSNNEGSLYKMNVKGDYYFDELLETGVSNDQELISFVTKKITKGLVKMDIKETEIGCAAFTAKLENGDRVFGRNYDFAKTNTCIVYTNPKGRYSSVSTVDLQFLGIDVNKDLSTMMNKITCLAAPFAPLDGVNEMGVSCGILMTYQGETTTPTDQQTDKIDITSTVMLRMILDYADSVEKAVELVSKYDLHDSAQTSYHYMVADATGKSAILEWVNGTDKTDNDGSKRELVVTYNDNDTHIGSKEGELENQWVTNFIIQPGYYESDEEKAGLDRYDVIYDNLVLKNGTFKDEAEAIEVLKAIGRRSFKPNGTVITVHSVIYNLTKKTSYFADNEHFEAENIIKCSVK